MVKFVNVDKSFNGNLIIKDINFTFNTGLYCLCGVSGSGKTTILNLIYGIEQPDNGKIDISPNQIVSYAVVEGDNIESLTVFDNLKLVCKDKKAISEIVETLGLSKVLNRKVSLLSAGERQRLSVARAYLNDAPSIFLFDEITANLDFEYSEAVFHVLSEMSLRKTVIIATHDSSIARKYCKRIVSIENHELVFDDNVSSNKEKLVSDVVNHGKNGELKDQGSNLPLIKLAFKKINIKPVLMGFLQLFMVLFSSFFVFGLNEASISDSKISHSLIESINKENLLLTNSSLITSLGNPSSIYGKYENSVFPAIKLSNPKLIDDKDVVYASVSNFEVSEGAMKSDIPFSIGNGKIEKGILNIPVSLDDGFLSLYNKTWHTDLKLGDNLDFGLEQYRENHLYNVNFYIADIVDGKSALDNFSQNPVIKIYESSFKKLVEKVGFYQDSLSFSGLKTDFNEFAKNNDLSNYQIAGSVNFSSNHVTSKTFVDYSWYSWEEDLPLDVSVVHFAGKIPTNKNEIMLPSSLAFALFGRDYLDYFPENEESMASFRPFVKNNHNGTYNYGLDDGLFNGFYKELVENEFIITGFYQLLGPAYRDEAGNVTYDNGIPKRPYSDNGFGPAIISESYFEEAEDWSINKKGLFGSLSNVLIDKQYALSNSDKVIKDFDIVDIYGEYETLTKVMHTQSILLLSISAVFFVIEIILLGIYSKVIIKEIKNNIYKMNLWGKRKGFAVLLCSSLVFGMYVSMVVGAIAGQCLWRLYANNYSSIRHMSYVLPTTFIPAFIYPIVIIASTLAATLLFFRKKKK